MTTHKVLDEMVDCDDYPFLYKTTHPGVHYDELLDVFEVLYNNGATMIEVYGKDRFNVAIKVADLLVEQ